MYLNATRTTSCYLSGTSHILQIHLIGWLRRDSNTAVSTSFNPVVIMTITSNHPYPSPTSSSSVLSFGGYLSRRMWKKKEEEDVEDLNPIKIQNPCKRYMHSFMRYICRCKQKEKYNGNNPRKFFNPMVGQSSDRSSQSNVDCEGSAGVKSQFISCD